MHTVIASGFCRLAKFLLQHLHPPQHQHPQVMVVGATGVLGVHVHSHVLGEDQRELEQELVKHPIVEDVHSREGDAPDLRYF